MLDLFLNHSKTKNIFSQDLLDLPASLCCSYHVNMGHNNSADPEVQSSQLIFNCK